MKWLIGLLLLLTTTVSYSANYYYAEIGVGKNFNLSGCPDCWEDQGELGALLGAGNRWDYPNYYIDAGLTHLSQYLAGPPVDSRKESSVDHIGIKIGVKF